MSYSRFGLLEGLCTGGRAPRKAGRFPSFLTGFAPASSRLSGLPTLAEGGLPTCWP